MDPLDEVYRRLRYAASEAIEATQNADQLHGVCMMWQSVEDIFPDQAKRIGKEDIIKPNE